MIKSIDSLRIRWGRKENHKHVVKRVFLSSAWAKFIADFTNIAIICAYHLKHFFVPWMRACAREIKERKLAVECICAALTFLPQRSKKEAHSSCWLLRSLSGCRFHYTRHTSSFYSLLKCGWIIQKSIQWKAIFHCFQIESFSSTHFFSVYIWNIHLLHTSMYTLLSIWELIYIPSDA